MPRIRYVNKENENDILNDTSLRKKYFMISFPRGTIKQSTLDFFKIPYRLEEVEDPEPSFEQLKIEATLRVQNESNALVRTLENGYTNGEIRTFEQQNLGAFDILYGNIESENAKFVIDLLKQRLGGVDEVSEDVIKAFANKIRENYLRAKEATIKIVGKQQYIELQIREAKTKEELEAIDMNITL